MNDAKAVLKYLYDTYHDHVYISMMSQFTPIALKDYPEINRTVTGREYERLVDYALEIGITMHLYRRVTWQRTASFRHLTVREYNIYRFS